MPTGELPRSLTVICDRGFVGSVSPGTRVTIVGIYAIQTSKDNKDAKGAIAIRNPFVRCALQCLFHTFYQLGRPKIYFPCLNVEKIAASP